MARNFKLITPTFKLDMELSENRQKGTVFSTEFSKWQESLYPLLDKSGLVQRLSEERQIIIKPNLVENLQPPITTPVALVCSIIDYLRDRVPNCKLIVAEGCGSRDDDTWHVFKELGYVDMAKEKNVLLLDLNEEECIKKENTSCERFPFFYLPAILFGSFLLSVPVLKAHSLAGVTLTMKNMMGAAPPKHYQQGGHWKKASFHHGIQQALFELNRYRTPDFTLLDATVGMSQAHLWGPTCSPPVNKLAAGFDPVAIDAYGCFLLGRDWKKIGHISSADGVLGTGNYTLKACDPC